MKIGILHLSDLHIKTENDKILSKCEHIVSSIQNEINKLDKLVILVTGDIAFSGSKSQYDIAYCLLDDIKAGLENKRKTQVDILTCPGNHDCLFSENDFVRDTIVEKVLKTNTITEKVIDICCEVQKEYFAFDRLFSESIDDIVYSDKLLKINRYTNSEQKIYFIGLNTSWLSQKQETPSKLYFPIRYYEEIIKNCSDGLVVTYFHHPSNWCHPDETNYLDDKIENVSDFIFLGHEHTEKDFMKQSGQNKVVYIKGSSLQENENKDLSSFCFMVIDSNRGEYKKTSYSYNQDIYYPKDDAEWVSYAKIIESREKRYKLTNENINFLKDVGFNLNHPRKDKLSLLDIYVYPDLEIININEKEETSTQKVHINSKELKITESTNNFFLILGGEKCGKTSLAKKLYLDYLDQDLCPIYVNGSEIKSKYCNDIQSLIFERFCQQYDNNKKEHFRQMHNSKKVIIIDDIDKMPLTPKLKHTFITNISEEFPNIIILANTLFDFEEILSSDKEMIINTQFQQYSFKNFGYKLKNQLIHKWNLVGEEDVYSDEDLVSKDEETFRNINTIIGNNYIPSVPFYILIILQSLEMGNEHNFKDSAYGHYYEFLILQTLNKISDIQGDIDAIKNFIVMLSRYFYTKSINKIPVDDLRKFHKEFCDEYRISKTFKKFIDFDIFIKDMCESNIFKYRYEMYEFSYKYIYYYCIGKYFAENISYEQIRSELSVMILKLYIEENANIVLFTIHHTKNEYLLNELLNKSKQIFNEHEFVRLEDDITFVNDLQCEIPKLTIGKIDLVKEREKKLEKLDRALDDTELVDQEVASTKQIQGSKEELILDKMNQLNFAFKSMEILGQVLKNYWGSLPGTVRKDIGKELYLLGLRSLREIYETFKGAKESLAAIINKNFEGRSIIDPEAREKKTKQMLFLFIGFFTHSYIYKIASCIGDDKLSETFNDIESDLDVNSIKLVNLAIKLEYFNKTFPHSYVEKLIKLNKNNLLPDFLIKHMVRDYLYMYKTSLSERSRIAALIGVPIKDVNIHEIKSLVEKD